MHKVKKAVIPAAGLGTRFLPVTKAIPKEMLPIVDVPTIQLIIEEAVQSGIEEIILITSKNKEAITNHFRHNHELERHLEETGKKELSELSKYAAKLCKLTPVIQEEALGLGHAVLCAERQIQNEPFAVLLGDDLIDANPPCTRQLIEVFQKNQKSVVGVMTVPKAEVKKYGIVDFYEKKGRLSKVKAVVEKPSPEASPSLLAIPGRYVLVPQVFNYLRQLTPGKGKEIQLTDGLQLLSQNEGLLAYEFEGNRYDAGDRLGYLEANIVYALKREELKKGLKEILKKYVD